MVDNSYLKLDGIKGESTEDQHKDQFALISYGFGVLQPMSDPGSTGGRAQGDASFDNFSVTMYSDIGQPDLSHHCALGKHIPEATFEVCQSTGSKECYLRVVMTNLLVHSCHVSGGGDGRPTLSLSLVFDSIKWHAMQITDTGDAGTQADREYSLVDKS